MKISSIIRYGLSCALLGAVIVLSIQLPGSIMQRAEDELIGNVYEESLNPADGGYKYSITSEEKHRLYTLFGLDEATMVSSAGPLEKGQLTLEQALASFQEELTKWSACGILPETFTIEENTYEINPQFVTIHDLEDPALSYDFWYLHLFLYDFGVKYDYYPYNGEISVFLDGYTGAICDFTMQTDLTVDTRFLHAPWDREKALKAFGEYHGVTTDAMNHLFFDNNRYESYDAKIQHEDVGISGSFSEYNGFRFNWVTQGEEKNKLMENY